MGELTLDGCALILGASSGFGAATALELARAGMDVFGVHLDRKATLADAEKVVSDIRALGREADFFNVNAVDPEKRAEVVGHIERKLKEQGRPGGVRVLLHSLAFGTLKPLCAPEGGDMVTDAQLAMTLDVMASSLVSWTQELVRRKLLGEGARIFALTSEGSTLAWPSYGPVAAAKAALESYCRQLIDQLLEGARRRNPHGRITAPRDVARCIALLSRPESAWLTGNVLGVDGGEHIAG